MNPIIGTAANDVITGTTAADYIEGGDGNDRINGGAGNDEIYGGRGADTLTGDAGDDRIFGEDGNDGIFGGGGNDYIDGGIGDDNIFGDGGNDTIIGGAGNDRLSGGVGNDVIDGGAGNDTLNGDDGDDVFVWRPGDGNDTIVGGAGNDRLELRLNSGDVTPQVLADLAAYQAWAASQTASTTATTGATFTFASLGLTISVLENVAVKVGGQDVSIKQLLNTAPTADAESQISATEDTPVQGRVAATDAQGDVLTYTVLQGPANGALALNPSTGAFTYTPGANYSGPDSFLVRVTDPFGASVTQTVKVAVAAVADAPSLSASDTTVTLDRVSTLTGTSGDDVLRGDQYAATATVALDLAAALTDNSEALSIRIGGVPAGATLSAGTLQTDGTWLLQPEDLNGLSLTTPTDADIALQITAISQDGISVAETATVLNVTFERGAAATDGLFARVALFSAAVSGGDLADTIIASAGNDVYDGGQDTDTVDYSAASSAVNVDLSTGTATGIGNHTLISIENVVGSSFADVITGDAGDNVLSGGFGNDTLVGGEGYDTLNGDEGDDAFIWRTGDGGDFINGGAGNDRLELQLNAGDIGPDFLADLSAYQTWAASAAPGDVFTFASLGVTITDVETLSISVDGKDVSIRQLLNAAPDADAEVQVSTTEDAAVQGQIAVTDADGDALAFAVLEGPAKGSVTLNAATGAFIYTPGDNYSGADSFVVRVTDPFGASVTQTVKVAVAAVADAPTLSVSNASATLDRIATLTGTSGDDVLRGDQYAPTATVALSLAAALTDRDGSEALSVRIGGIPAGATLSAGTLQSDGSWLLQPAQLSGLTLTTPTGENLALQVTVTAQDGASVAEVSSVLNVTFERGGNLNDTIIASGGNDAYDGGQGTDTVDYSGAAAAVSVDLSLGTATGIGNHTLSAIENVVGSSFDDTLMGNAGDNVISGGAGNDLIIGGKGNDNLAGDFGDDVFVWRNGDGNDAISGGAGSDRIELHLDAVTPQILTDLAAYQSWAASAAPGASFTFSTLGVTITDVEAVSVVIGGQSVSIRQLLNTAPVAAAEVQLSASEDTPLQGQIVATDAQNDALVFTVLNGPAKGSVTLNQATGSYIYTPASNYSGADSFVVRVTDPFGASATQTVKVAVAAVADAPVLSATSVSQSLARIATLTGTAGNDVLRGDQYVATATLPLVIAAALADLDGSEVLSVRIGGIPPGAALSAGTLQSDGSWLLQPSHLSGLTLTAPTANNLALQVTATAQDGSSVAQSSTVLNVTFERGGNLNDTIIASGGNDVYDGGQGTDTVDYSGAAAAVTVDLSVGTATGIGNHTLTSIENVVGSRFNDIITGNAGNNVINGGAGSDRLFGLAGDDTFIASVGDDRYDGGAGFDVLDYSTATRAIQLQDGQVSGAGSDRYSNIEKVIGTAFADRFEGGKNADNFDGGAGNDWFRGFEGNDTFTGGSGNDTFVWQDKDAVSGKKSAGVDTITDFGAGDVLDVRSMSGGSLTAVKVTDTAAGSMVAVQVGGTFYDVVLLQNVHGVTTNSLFAGGQLIA